MKTFKEYLVEAKYDPKEESNNFNKSEARHKHNIDGWNVHTSLHAGSQALLRRPEFKKEDWKDLHTKVISHIKDKAVPNGEHIFYSSKKRQGYVADVNHEKKQIKIITTLETGTSRAARPNTTKHIVESEYITFVVD